MTKSPSITLYHNPRCGRSRNTLQFIRDAGIEPQVIEYLKTPPTRQQLEKLARRIQGGARRLLREKEPLAAELGLLDSSISDQRLIAAIAAHPILLNRPVVVRGEEVEVCRPSETVKEFLAGGNRRAS
ncbi:MAG TPA: arsenate reductase (glutaredoxin) [Nevskiaceae bacterium]|nr:arsenate reductase (glutaredoxin) [Nevskiaceae bacterium]